MVLHNINGGIFIIDYFENQEILKKISARLDPPSNLYPDCICELILTEKNLFVLEDNFDGTYDWHFEIPIEEILSMEKYVFGEKGVKKKENSMVSVIRLIFQALAFLNGFLFFLGTKKQSDRVFLKVTFKTKINGFRELQFEECSNLAGMIKAFNKYSSPVF